MAATYPADTFQEGVDLTIEASNQLAQVVRGDANTEVTVADGSTIPSIRKAQADSMYFKEPELWTTGQTETDYLQLKKYINPVTSKESWWFAKGALVSNPIAMGTSPFGDDNWTLYTPEDLFISGKAEYESVYQALKGKAAEAGYNLVRGSFEEGGTLTSSTDVLWYQSNGRYYSWAGTFPKVVAAGATPATSGGIGAGAWVDRTDVTLRSELEELESAVLIAGAKASEIVSVNPRRFGAHPITEVGYETFDSTQAFQDAIDYAIANNIGTVEFDGQYLIDTALWSFDLPSDDGTVYPAWVGAGDANLTPETVYQMPVCLKIPDDIALRGRNKSKDVLKGSWDITSSTIDVNQKIGILITTGSKYDGVISYKLLDFQLRDFFIARVVEGTSYLSEETLRIVDCGISGVMQGTEQKTEGEMEYIGCLAGDVHGGWWTQRNSTRQDTAYLPPYPANDVFSIGWTDACKTGLLSYNQFVGVWGTRHEQIDAFFDTYFYKDSNSVRTGSGGRLSNNDAPNPAIITPYYGVAGRARTVYSRYGRAVASYTIDLLKTLRCHRTNVFYSPESSSFVLGCTVKNTYVERAGLIDNTTTSPTSNIFGVDNNDLYRPVGYGIGFVVAHGPSTERVVTSSACQPAPISNASAQQFYGSITSTKQKYAAAYETASQSKYFLDFTTFGDVFKRHYRAHEDWLYTQPLRFGSEAGEDFSYDGTTAFTPTLYSDAVEVPFTLKTGNYKKIGKTVYFYLDLYKSTAVAYPNGVITITGLPLLPAAATASISARVSQFNGLNPGLTVGARLSGKTLYLTVDSAGTSLNGSQCNTASSEGLVRMSGMYFIS